MDFSCQSPYPLPSLPDGFSLPQRPGAAQYSPDQLNFLDARCFRTVFYVFSGTVDVYEDHIPLAYLHKYTGKSTHDSHWLFCTSSSTERFAPGSNFRGSFPRSRPMLEPLSVSDPNFSVSCFCNELI